MLRISSSARCRIARRTLFALLLAASPACEGPAPLTEPTPQSLQVADYWTFLNLTDVHAIVDSDSNNLIVHTGMSVDAATTAAQRGLLQSGFHVESQDTQSYGVVITFEADDGRIASLAVRDDTQHRAVSVVLIDGP